MALPLALLRTLQNSVPGDAWSSLLDYAWKVCTAPVTAARAASEIPKRDAEVGSADLFLATAGWDLWRSFEKEVPRTADVLAAWWSGHTKTSGRAVLILDALSLREVPWILQCAVEQGYTIHQARAVGSELPADTIPFAKALGFSGRSSLQNNGASGASRLPGATTDLPWADCAAEINASRDWVLWHHWPDVRLHDLSAPGHGLAALAREAAEKLQSDGFWELIHCLTEGRRLVITADHGYAASGAFPDTADGGQAQYLKERFKSGRWAAVADLVQPDVGAWVPPLDMRLGTAHGENVFALGRRKWKSQGGYPTLTHGGLTLLEVAVPFIELSRAQGG